jgi:hypothetical protein
MRLDFNAFVFGGALDTVLDRFHFVFVVFGRVRLDPDGFPPMSVALGANGAILGVETVARNLIVARNSLVDCREPSVRSSLSPETTQVIPHQVAGSWSPAECIGARQQGRL